jgi:rubredoxin
MSSSNIRILGGDSVNKYQCNVCGYVYDPEKGDPTQSIPPGTPFESLPEDWTCPECGVPKEEFSKI